MTGAVHILMQVGSLVCHQFGLAAHRFGSSRARTKRGLRPGMVRLTCRGSAIRLHSAMPSPLTVTFTAGAAGSWRIERISAVRGEPLASAACLAVTERPVAPEAGVWCLRGVVGHPRYSTTAELRQLAAMQPALNRPEASCAALIPIRKSDAWWAMGQDDRRAIFEDSSPAYRALDEASACRRAPAASQPRSRRGVRLPHLVRIRARA